MGDNVDTEILYSRTEKITHIMVYAPILAYGTMAA